MIAAIRTKNHPAPRSYCLLKQQTIEPFLLTRLTEMKNERTLETHGGRNVHGSPEKFNLIKPLIRVWRDLEDKQRWKYDNLSPVRLLEKLKLNEYPADKDELARAEHFWSCRLRLLPVISYVFWLSAALGLPVWLFIVPTVGLPLLIVSALLVNTEIVRSVRWRRQYELSIDRLIHTLIGPSASTPKFIYPRSTE